MNEQAELELLRRGLKCFSCGVAYSPEISAAACDMAHRKHWTHEWVTQRVIDLTAKAVRLMDIEIAIRDVHSQHADDLCWMPADVNKIFVAAGLPPQDLRVGDMEAMRKNCDRYIACLQSGGPWKSYAENEAALTELVSAVQAYCGIDGRDGSRLIQEWFRKYK